VSVISCELEDVVIRSEITKGFIGYDVKDEELFPERFKNPRAIAVYKPDDRFIQSYWGRAGILAIAAASEIVICTLEPFREQLKIKRPKTCKATAVPYIDFGFGLSPSYQDQTLQMLAIGWDNLI
jgi:hypothetical protein